MSFWGITTYFNPCNYKRRLENYRIFRKFLRIPLLTVEWSQKGDFQLTAEDADLLIQITGGDILWQKERLLNIGVSSLPADCTKVAWLDCDILFPDNNWHLEAEKMLDEVLIIQLYKNLFYLLPNNLEQFDLVRNKLEFIHQRESTIHCIKRGAYDPLTLVSIARPELTSASGMAWAARKEFLKNVRFYDANIVGGGDSALLYAIMGNQKYFIDRLSDFHFKHYINWANKVLSKINGQFNYLDTDIYHLWHGSLEKRLYSERYSWLTEANFDPDRDIKIADSGCWQWSSSKPQLHKQIENYFYLRDEDNG